MESKKTIRSNKNQINYLCKYMSKHIDLASGDYSASLQPAQQRRQWNELKSALDKLGPIRSIDQWKTCWRDQKRKARMEADAMTKATNSIDYVPTPKVSINTPLILETIGQAMPDLPATPDSERSTSPAIPPPPPLAPRPVPKSDAPSFPLIIVPDDLPPESESPPLRAPRLRRPVRRHVRVSQLTNRSLNARLELNELMRELISELRQTNDLHRQRNMILRRTSRKR